MEHGDRHGGKGSLSLAILFLAFWTVAWAIALSRQEAPPDGSQIFAAVAGVIVGGLLVVLAWRQRRT